MKLRIAQRADGKFIIQKRVFLFWWKWASFISDLHYPDYLSAKTDAILYLRGLAHKKYDDRIVQGWEVNEGEV